MDATAVSGSVFAEDLSASAPHLEEVRASNAVYRRMLALQAGLQAEAAAALGLRPRPGAPCDGRGAFFVNAEPMRSSAAVQAFSCAGTAVEGYVTASIACAQLGFGVMRTLGWAGAGSDVPHLALEFGPAGGGAQCYLSLMPRRSNLLDSAYNQYWDASPPGGLPSFCELHATCMAAEGWVPFEPRGLLMRAAGGGLAMSYKLPAGEEALALLEATARGVLRLWLAHLAAAGTGGAIAPARLESAEERLRVTAAYDAAHRGVVRADTGNAQAAAMFGEDAVAALVGLLVLEA